MEESARFEHLAPYYDALFPVREVQLDFLESCLHEGAPRRVLDLGCGTGLHLEALTERGLAVCGIDLDEFMVDRLKMRRPDLARTVMVGDMRKVGSILRDAGMDPPGLIYCIGNSLVQLTDDEDIERTLRACRECLGREGSLAVQIVNFDRVLNGEWGLLPPIKRELEGKGAFRLERLYAPSDPRGRVRFSTRLETPDGTEERFHDLRALRREELEHLLRGAGFNALFWYGDYDGREWHPEESSATIVWAAR